MSFYQNDFLAFTGRSFREEVIFTSKMKMTFGVVDMISCCAKMTFGRQILISIGCELILTMEMTF